MMGGLAVEVPNDLTESRMFLPPKDRKQWFVTNSVIEALLRQDLGDKIPDLSEEEIKSKSKANGLAKALVCVQALWFIAQCITRRMYRRFSENPCRLQ